MAKLRLASALQQDSIVDGPGIRMVIWTQGCMHNCKGCHNPQTHDLAAGELVTSEEIIAQMKEAQLQTGLTLSGGEPFLQSEALLPIVQAAKEMRLNIWAYSGFTYEQLISHEEYRNLLNYLDVLVDGKFIEEEKDYRLKFKGSKNQRIIDVQESLKQNKIIRSTYDDKNTELFS